MFIERGTLRPDEESPLTPADVVFLPKHEEEGKDRAEEDGVSSQREPTRAPFNDACVREDDGQPERAGDGAGDEEQGDLSPQAAPCVRVTTYTAPQQLRHGRQRVERQHQQRPEHVVHGQGTGEAQQHEAQGPSERQPE